MTERSGSGLAHFGFELVVIIVGVLIALGVDQWAEGRRERSSEGAYLQALAADLRDDSTGFAEVWLPALAQKDSALRMIAPVVRGAPLPGDTMAFLDAVSLGGRLGTPSPMVLARRTTFDELIATGNLSLIRSRSLRATLVDHYNNVEIQSRRLLARIPDYPMAVHAYYPAELRGAKSDADVRAFGVRRAVEAFRSPEFEAVMDRELNFMYFATAVMHTLADRTDELLRMVEAQERTGRERGPR